MTSDTKGFTQPAGLWYHATSFENWAKIQAEGVLWGIRNAPSRCTYLAAERQHAVQYGEVLLAVAFQPETDTPNNYADGTWQCRVYAPIPLSRVRVLVGQNA
jgi:hypothetical protein